MAFDTPCINKQDEYKLALQQRLVFDAAAADDDDGGPIAPLCYKKSRRRSFGSVPQNATIPPDDSTFCRTKLKATRIDRTAFLWGYLQYIRHTYYTENGTNDCVCFKECLKVPIILSLSYTHTFMANTFKIIMRIYSWSNNNTHGYCFLKRQTQLDGNFYSQIIIAPMKLV